MFMKTRKGACSYELLLSALQETERPIFIFDPKGELERLQIQAGQKRGIPLRTNERVNKKAGHISGLFT